MQYHIHDTASRVTALRVNYAELHLQWQAKGTSLIQASISYNAASYPNRGSSNVTTSTDTDRSVPPLQYYACRGPRNYAGNDFITITLYESNRRPILRELFSALKVRCASFISVWTSFSNDDIIIGCVFVCKQQETRNIFEN